MRNNKIEKRKHVSCLYRGRIFKVNIKIRNNWVSVYFVIDTDVLDLGSLSIDYIFYSYV